MERVEEYLEAMLDIQKEKGRAVRTSDLAKRLNVKPSSVTEMLLKLSKEGYVEYQPYRGAVLTEKGRILAERIKRYHMIFEKFFRDFLGIDENEAHRLSCELEHHVNDEIVEKVCKIIASECRICEKCEFEAQTLIDAQPGRYEVLACPLVLKSLGIKPGSELIVIGKRTIEIDGSRFEISETLAEKIVIKRISEE